MCILSIRICMGVEMSARIDWNHIRAFLLSAETGSFSRASEKLATSQPTLSRQVSALEETLELTLFERVGKGVMLTSAGEQLLQHAQTMEEAFNQFSLVATGQSQNLEGQVCISASEIDAMFRMPDIILYLNELEPGIQIKLIASNQASDLKQREADIAIRSFRPTEPDLIAKKLGDERIWFFGDSAYVGKLNQDPPEQGFPQLRVVGFDDTRQMLEILNASGWKLGQRNISVITHSHTTQWQLVRGGMGVGLFPEHIGMKDSSLSILYPDLGPPMTLPLWLVSHRELRSNPRVRRVFDIIADKLLIN